MNRIGRELVSVLRAPLVQGARSASLHRNWATAVSTDYDSCSVQPFLMSNKLVVELEDQREFASQVYRVWGPADMDVESTDRIMWRARLYDVRGPMGRFPDLRGNLHHVQFLMIERLG
jgi:hypothetical protein